METITQSTIKTVLHYYKFNTKEPEEKKQYNELCTRLRGMGLNLFDCISMNKNIVDYYVKNIKPLDGKVVELEINHLFNNQWNTAPTETSETGLRVFDWSEEIFIENKYSKMGMWLEQTAEMTDIRQHTCKCSYCGAQYFKPTIEFCTECIGSEYLTEDSLPLLFLTPVNKSDHKYNWDSVKVPAQLIAEFKERHQQTMTKKLEKQQAAKLASIENDIENSKKEYEAFKWLIDRHLDFENVIYYSHTKEFSFGWRTPLTEQEKADLRIKLTDFPFAWEFSKK